MIKILSTAAMLAVVSVAAFAQQSTPASVLTVIPATSVSVTNWYKKSVYDPSDSKGDVPLIVELGSTSVAG
jgi:hypothetical protein